MSEMWNRTYPVGNDDFVKLRTKGQLYVDKTQLMWNMIHLSDWIFLSRPRRFGKSLLSSTLKAYFEGRRELFEGLAVGSLEKDWIKYPVFHFNLASLKDVEVGEMRQVLLQKLEPLEKIYGISDRAILPGARLADLIQRANAQTGLGVVLIFDEYDSPLLNRLDKSEDLERARTIMQEFYQPIKDCSAYERFTFITGITKFSQLSIFSSLNNLNNISMLPQFASLAGFTAAEIDTVFRPDMEHLGQMLGLGLEETRSLLRKRYDGYHFSGNSEGVYNPYSLVKCFANCYMGDYWFDSGTPKFIFKVMQRYHTDITSLSRLLTPSSGFDLPTEAMNDALPLLYQSGYLTIKDYDAETMLYTLDFPNEEVRGGFIGGLIPTYIGLESSNVQMGFAVRFWQALRKDDLELGLRELKAYMAGLPYIEGFRKKLSDVSTAEGFYEWTFYLIFSMLNVYVRTQVKCIRGRINVVVEMPRTVYVMELKLHGTPLSALKQIDSGDYALPWSTDGRKVVKAGIRFDMTKLSIKDWKIV